MKNIENLTDLTNTFGISDENNTTELIFFLSGKPFKKRMPCYGMLPCQRSEVLKNTLKVILIHRHLHTKMESHSLSSPL